MKAFLLRFLLFLVLFLPFYLKSAQVRGSQEIPSYFSKENCDPDSLVADSVHVGTGKLLVSQKDFSVPGTEKIEIQRHYTSQELWSYFPHTVLVLGESDEKPGYKKEGRVYRYIKAFCGEKSGALFSYFGWLADGVDGKLQCCSQGLINCAHEEIGGKTNPKNIKISSVAKEDCFELVTGNGSKRIYTKRKIDRDGPFEYVLDGPLYNQFAKSLKSFDFYFLQKELCSNGNIILYFYDQQCLLKEIRVTGTKEQTLGFVTFDYGLNEATPRVSIKTSSENVISYFFDRIDNGELRLKEALTEVRSSKYVYKNKKLIKEVCSDGTFFEVTYGSEKGGVEAVHSYTSLHEHFKFSYDTASKTPFATVFDKQSNMTKYRLSDNRLITIEMFDAMGVLQRAKQKFFGKGCDLGNLISETLSDTHGDIVSCTTYTYDSNGNVIQEDLYGDLVGKETPPIQMNDKGLTTENPLIACHTKKRRYSADGFNLLVVQGESKGGSIEYEYKPGTDLVTAKFIFGEKSLIKRIFFDYDDNGSLIKQTVDDGNAKTKSYQSFFEQQIQELTVTKDFPIGLPQIITEKYYDKTTKKELTKRKQLFTYDRQGRMLSCEIEGRAGEKRTEASALYDGNGRLLEERGTSQEIKKYTYNIQGDVASLTIGNKQELFSYDDKRRLVRKEEVYSTGKVFNETYEYDAFDNKTAVTDIFGNTTLYTYDSFGRVTEISLPEIHVKEGSLIRPVCKYTYDSFNRIASTQDPEGNITSFIYNIRGKPNLIRYPDGTQERFSYDTEGSLHRKATRDGFVLIYLYDFLGRVQSVETFTQDEKGPGVFQSKRAYEYNTMHLTDATDERGYKFHSTYDGSGNLIKVEGTLGWKEDETPFRVHFEYDAFERISSYKEWFSKKENDFLRTIFRYGVGDRPLETKTVDADEKVISLKEFEYDASGNRTKTCLQGQLNEFITYNELNEPVTIADASGNVTFLTYEYFNVDDSGQKVFTQIITDPSGTKKTNLYDAYGSLVSSFSENATGQLLEKKQSTFGLRRNISEEITSLVVEGAIHGEQKTQYSYDSMNRLLLIEEGDEPQFSKKREFKYNKYGQLIQRYEPGLTDPISYSYSYQSQGVTVKVEYPIIECQAPGEKKGQKTYFSLFLDNAGRVKRMDSQDGLKVERSYGYINQILKETVSLSGVGDYTSRYRTDGLGRTTEITLPDSSSIHYEYERAFLKEIVRRDAGGIQQYSHQYLEYDTLGLPKKESLIGAVGERENERNYGFRKTGVATDFYKEHISQKDIDPSGNILASVKETPNHTLACSFAYNELSQLISEQGVESHTYEYDSIGNQKTINGTKPTFNSLNQLLSFGDCSFTYDERGALRTKTTPSGTIDFFYDAFQHLKKICGKDKEIQFLYDGLGRRIVQKDMGHGKTSYNFFLYFNNEEIGLVSPNGLIRQLKIPGLENSIAFELDREVVAPLFDLQNNVVSLINPDTREVIESYEYSAFGKERILNQNGEEVDESQVNNPWRFFGKRKDSFTGFILFEAREYDPFIQRWTSPDPLGPIDSVNLYLYTKANPLKYRDEFGLSSQNYYIKHESFEAYISSDRQHQSDRMGELGDLEKGRFPSYPKRSGNFVEIFSTQYSREQIIDKLKNEKDFSDQVICHINGINTNFDEVCRRAEKMINNSRGRIVAVIIAYNATEGVVKDALESLININSQFYHIHSKVERELTSGLTGIFNELKDARFKIKIGFHCHSQGAAIMDCILHNTKEFDSSNKARYRDYLGSIYTYGGATLLVEATNFLSPGECVHNGNCRNANVIRNHSDRIRHTSFRKQTHMEAHSFDGPSYQEAFQLALNSEFGD